MNPIIKEANEYMEAKDASLKCNDFPNTVEVHHEDGSHFVFQNARTERTTIGKYELLLVWTEHCGYIAFFMDDLEFWKRYQQV